MLAFASHKSPFHFAVIAAALLFSLLALAVPDSPDLESGYRQMYNLNFDGAHATFQSWEKSHPNDPMGPASNAAAYLFSEFERLHILESDLFVDNQKFQNRQRPQPDAATRAAFMSELSRSEAIANQILAASPQDANALFARVLADGLRGDYLAMIEKRNLAGLSSMKAGRSLAEKLISLDRSYYDAYLAIGMENYLLGLSSAPVRWFLRLGGAQTDKDNGLANLRLTAEKGHYLAPYARLVLAVAALRDKDRNTARTLLAGLSREFPGNHLYQQELARIQP